MDKFMKAAIGEALRGMRKNTGGPFGAVVAKDGKIIARGHNRVLATNDPTAHAEIVAIRKAAKRLGRFDLSDCVVYTTSEPCPMCFAAIRWAKIKTVYYGCSVDDAAAIGFADKKIREEICSASALEVRMAELDRAECLGLFEEWMNKKDRKLY